MHTGAYTHWDEISFKNLLSNDRNNSPMRIRSVLVRYKMFCVVGRCHLMTEKLNIENRTWWTIVLKGNRYFTCAVWISIICSWVKWDNPGKNLAEPFSILIRFWVAIIALMASRSAMFSSSVKFPFTCKRRSERFFLKIVWKSHQRSSHRIWNFFN